MKRIVAGASNYQTNPNPQRHSERRADRRRLEKLSIVRTLPHAPGRNHGGRAGFGNNCRRAGRPRNLCGEDPAESLLRRRTGMRLLARSTPKHILRIHAHSAKVFPRRCEHERGEQAHARRSGALGGARDPGTDCAEADGARRRRRLVWSAHATDDGTAMGRRYAMRPRLERTALRSETRGGRERASARRLRST